MYRLLDAVDEAVKPLDDIFNSDDVRNQLAKLYPAILKRVHKASITGALARLAEVGVLERVTPGGRGRKASFRLKNDGISSISITKKYNDNSNEITWLAVLKAMEYLWRIEHKGDTIENLKKAKWYIDREIERLSK